MTGTMTLAMKDAALSSIKEIKNFLKSSWRIELKRKHHCTIITFLLLSVNACTAFMKNRLAPVRTCRYLLLGGQPAKYFVLLQCFIAAYRPAAAIINSRYIPCIASQAIPTTGYSATPARNLTAGRVLI